MVLCFPGNLLVLEDGRVAFIDFGTPSPPPVRHTDAYSGI
jgi:predicted unusual protein kinase regulating ubiquinone biosynthesis (AarF/ABC1/UbiB family)